MTHARPDLIAGLPVLFVMAARAEYGPALAARINPLITGIGPIEAAVQLTAALAGMAERPHLIVSLGSAGSARLMQGRVYQVSRLAWRDIDASALGFARGTVPFLDLPEEVTLPLRIAGIPEASLSTGGNIVSGAAYDAIAQDMVDMETFAHMRAADWAGLPLIGLRGISDGAEELRELADWTQYLDVIDERLAEAVDALAEGIASGAIAP